VLRRFPDAYLVLIKYEHYREAEAHLRAAAAARGIAPRRLLFLPEGSHRRFLQIGGSLDLFLDTGHPLSNGHTTVADMLWARVTVVTYAGPAKPSRVASSVALASKCGVLVARDLADYFALSVAWLRGRRRSAAASRHPIAAAAPPPPPSTTCSPSERMFSAAHFMRRWLRALQLLAEAPHAHVVVS
jgi:predicted O-linked N-acetylglucosamine transferase (SPINDLY family)